MEAQDLLTNLGTVIGLPDLKFDAQGCARLVFDQSTPVDLEHDPQSGCIQVYSVLGPTPPGDDLPLYRKLLEANLFGTETHGATLAIDAVRREILLCRRVDLSNATVDSFNLALESFVATTEHWKQQLDRGEVSDAASPPAYERHLQDFALRG